MPPRKTEQMVEVLRNEILSGRRAPGAKLPTYDDFTEQFGVARPTVARGLKLLRDEGLVTAVGTRGVFVSKTFPHLNRLLWVTSEQPGTSSWSGLSATLLALIERGETGLPGEIVPLVGVDGRANNPAYRALCEAVLHRSAVGVFVVGSPTTALLPVLQTPGLPRVVLGAPVPHATTLTFDDDAFFARAAARLGGARRRVAVLSPDANHLLRAGEALVARGLPRARLAKLHVAPVGCEALAALLFERADRPEAVLVADDSLVAPLLAGLARAEVRPGRDVHVLARGHWPHPDVALEGVEVLGFDVRELLAEGKQLLDARRAGEEPRARAIAPRFASELAPRKALASAA